MIPHLSLSNSILVFLREKVQIVASQTQYSVRLSIGVPQGCVFGPLTFSVLTLAK